MSADTTCLMVARRFYEDGPLLYSATIVQCVGNAYDGGRDAMDYLRGYFDVPGVPWFRTISRAKQFAHLISEDLRENGNLKYENRPFLEMGFDGRVYRLSHKGKRLGLVSIAPVRTPSSH